MTVSKSREIITKIQEHLLLPPSDFTHNVRDSINLATLFFSIRELNFLPFTFLAIISKSKLKSIINSLLDLFDPVIDEKMLEFILEELQVKQVLLNSGSQGFVVIPRTKEAKNKFSYKDIHLISPPTALRRSFWISEFKGDGDFLTYEEIATYLYRKYQILMCGADVKIIAEVLGHEMAYDAFWNQGLFVHPQTEEAEEFIKEVKLKRGKL